jgi:hypothetical protein
MGLSTHYEQNLVALIKQLRVQYNAPNAKFVTASLGQTKMPNVTEGGNADAWARRNTQPGDVLILEAMLNVANATKFPGRLLPEIDSDQSACTVHACPETKRNFACCCSRVMQSSLEMSRQFTRTR